MDEAVHRALAKWPNVPACYGWLALDRRGRWRMRDEHAQAHGLLGDIVRNAALKAFIDRNYERDADGAWFFQNGPQRVFVNLEATPYVLLIAPTPDGRSLQCSTHTGAAVPEVHTAYVDDAGNFYLAFANALGKQIGLVCDRDLPTLLECLRSPDGQPPGPQETLDLLAESPFALTLALPFAQTPLRLHSLHAQDLAGRFDFIAQPIPRDA